MGSSSLWGRPYAKDSIWARRLENARDAEAVVQAARDFLSEWTPEELSALPEGCRAPALRDVDDLAIYALTVTQEHCRDDQQGPELNGMAAFFTAASTRVSLILARAKGDPSGLFLTR
jgi:hypothetical protein